MSDTLLQANPATRSAKAVRLREARFEDYAQVSALESKFELGPKNYEEWTHLWINNPAFRELQDKLPIGWVLENEEGKISGYLGNIPVACELEGKPLLAATTRAWVVDEPSRSYALLLLATYFKQLNVDLFLNTSVNAESAQAYGSFQGIRVPVGEWDRSVFWITHYPGFTESFLRKRGGMMTKPLSYLLSAGALLADRVKKRGFPAENHRVPVESCGAFDERFDVFWAALRKMKSRQLLSVRSREVLGWHFKYSLLKGEAWIYTVEERNGLIAYAVFDRHDYNPVGLKRMRLTDFQCLDDNQSPVLLSAMLKAAMERCRRESLHMLELTGLSARMEAEIERAAPHHRQLSNWRYFYKARHAWLAERLKSPDAWNPSFYDGDSSL